MAVGAVVETVGHATSRYHGVVSHASHMDQPNQQTNAKPSKLPRQLGLGVLVALCLFFVNRGYSAVNTAPSWIVGTMWFTGAAICLVILIWLWGPTEKSHWIIRLLLSILAVVAVFLSSFSAIRTQYRRETIEATPPVKANEQPALKAFIMVDSVSRETVNFHVELENGPTFPLRDILFKTQTPDEIHIETQPPISRELLPGEKLSLATDPFSLKPRYYNSVTLVTFYTATVETLEKRFSCTYKFFFSLDQAKKLQVINPAAISRGEEHTIGRQQDVQNTTLSGLAKLQGSIIFVVPELKDGHPNMTGFGNEKRQFLFDPIARTVLFRTKIGSGKIMTFSQQLRPTESGTHIIAIVWDDSKGGALAVDGVEKRNMSGN